jgi:hypothetical protein
LPAFPGFLFFAPVRRSFVGARRGSSKWKLGVWLVFLGCVALIAALLVNGVLPDAGFTLKAEVFAGIFIFGCVFLVMSSRSGRKDGD